MCFLRPQNSPEPEAQGTPTSPWPGIIAYSFSVGRCDEVSYLMNISYIFGCQGAADRAYLSPVQRSDQGGGTRRPARRVLFQIFFWFPNGMGAYAPFCNLRGLNEYLRPLKYKMLTIPRVRHAVNKGDWVVIINLKNAYFQIPIWKGHWSRGLSSRARH